MERLSRFYPDPVVLFTTLLLSLMGLLSIVSVKVAPHIMEDLELTHLRRPLLFALFLFLGLLLMSATSYLLDYKKLNNQRVVYGMVIFSLSLLTFVLVKKVVLGKPVERWLVGTSVQPSELSKLIIIFFIAYYVARKGSIDRLRFFGWAVFVVMLHSTLLFLQPDKGMSLFVLVIAWTMLWAGGTHPRIYLPVAGLFIAFMSILFLFSGGYAHRRIAVWLSPMEDSFGSGYQIIQSLLAFMNGGLLGQGYGKGFQKLGPLTQADTDYVLATIGEELGFPGILFIFTLFTILIWRLLRIANETVDVFGKLIVFGITLNILLAVVVNVMMSINLLPPKGIPLPFVSYGISNLMVNFLALGVVGAVQKRQLRYSLL